MNGSCYRIIFDRIGIRHWLIDGEWKLDDLLLPLLFNRLWLLPDNGGAVDPQAQDKFLRMSRIKARQERVNREESVDVLTG